MIRTRDPRTLCRLKHRRHRVSYGRVTLNLKLYYFYLLYNLFLVYVLRHPVRSANFYVVVCKELQHVRGVAGSNPISSSVLTVLQIFFVSFSLF